MEKNKKGVILFPEHLVELFMKHLHGATHYGKDSLIIYVKPRLTVHETSKAISKVIAGCVVCQKNTTKTQERKKALPRTVPI